MNFRSNLRLSLMINLKRNIFFPKDQSESFLEIFLKKKIDILLCFFFKRKIHEDFLFESRTRFVFGLKLIFNKIQLKSF